jgi:hypothetical protein
MRRSASGEVCVAMVLSPSVCPFPVVCGTAAPETLYDQRAGFFGESVKFWALDDDSLSHKHLRVSITASATQITGVRVDARRAD